MFGAIKSFIRNSRIKIDYPRYEREQLVAHLAQADRRFDASQLDKEIAQIRQQATAAGDQRFGSDVASLRQRVAATEHGLRKDRQQSGMRSIGTMPKSVRSWRRLAQ